MLTGIELIVYDLDGVLIDSSGAILIAFNTALREVGFDVRPEEEILGMIGMPLDEMYRKVLPRERWGLVSGCFDRFKEVFAEVSLDHVRLLDGVESTLAHFESEGLMQCVATNKSTSEAERLLEHLGVHDFFDLIIGFDDVVTPKPGPDMVLLALEAMGVEAGAAVLVEDSPTGLKAGKAADVHTVAVTTGTYSAVVLSSSSPEYLIDDIKELMKLIFV